MERSVHCNLAYLSLLAMLIISDEFKYGSGDKIMQIFEQNLQRVMFLQQKL
ncbi:hypothetical protein Lser_V15G10588 [Lactuca serriola]